MVTLTNLFKPRLPSSALGLTGEGAAVVSLKRRRDLFVVRGAGYFSLPENLLRPDFDEPNVSDATELAATLAELASNVGMGSKRRWSVALPEAATRTAIITLEDTPKSRMELEEMLRWKAERSFGIALDELKVSRVRLKSSDANASGVRYLMTAIRRAVLSEYEAVFASLNWRAGMILPEHLGEAMWLKNLRGGSVSGGAVLLSAHRKGFTAALIRAGEPQLLRSVSCDAADCADEFYRFLLFYRDRALNMKDASADADAETESADSQVVAPNVPTKLFVAGSGFSAIEAREVMTETFDVVPHLVTIEDVRLDLPSPDLSFAQIAAPAGLAALAWG